MRCRLAIRAANLGPEADFSGEQCMKNLNNPRKNEGALREQ